MKPATKLALIRSYVNPVNTSQFLTPQAHGSDPTTSPDAAGCEVRPFQPDCNEGSGKTSDRHVPATAGNGSGLYGGDSWWVRDAKRACAARAATRPESPPAMGQECAFDRALTTAALSAQNGPARMRAFR